MKSQLEPTDLMAWLDSHINLERTGPSASGRNYDPTVRLANSKNLYALCDDPQEKFESIHITGTNGKTSTSRIATQLLVSMGLRTGSYTSPHLQKINERIAINTTPVADDEFFEALNSIRLLETMIDEEALPSYFEILTAAAFRIFADAPIAAGVIEVGLGGRFDSTNVLNAPVAVITNIGDDHQNFLGPTRAHIADQKVGIVGHEATLVTAEQDPDLLSRFEKAKPARMHVLGRDFEVISNKLGVGGRMLDIRTPLTHYNEVFVSLHGPHQGVNAATALVAAEAFFGHALPEDAVAEAFDSVSVPGRMEIVSREPLCILDGAHNVDAAEKVTAALDETFGGERDRVLVVGVLDPHDPAEFLHAIQAHRARLVIACHAPSPRAVDPQRIATAATDQGAPSVVIADVSAAIDEAFDAATDESVILITGSLYVAGAARDHLQPLTH